jgi:Ca2+-transporting ATPase
LALNWIYPNIFSPVHIIFLELIMGPTCSVIYENEPIEPNTMLQKPKPISTTFFNLNELSVSIVQGLFITLGTLSVYQFAVAGDFNETLTRTMVFTVLITANIFLTLVNRSFTYSILTTLKYKNDMVLFIVFFTIVLMGVILYIRPVTLFFEFETLNSSQLLTSIAIGFVSVIWFEIIKLVNKTKKG